MNVQACFLVSALAVVSTAFAQTGEPAVAELAPLEKVEGGTWSEAVGTGSSRQLALANAIENSVARVNGLRVAKGQSLLARISLVKTNDASVSSEDGALELGKVTQQLEGFVLQMDVKKASQLADRSWEVCARCLVSAYDPSKASFVVQLGGLSTPDGRTTDYVDLDSWRTEVRDEGSGISTPSRLEILRGTDLRECLVNSGRIKVSARGPGILLGDDSDPREAAKKGKALVAAHRVEVQWSPIVVFFTMDRPDVARPSSQRPQRLQGASVTASVRVRNLVERTDVVATTVEIACPAAMFQGIALDDAGLQRILEATKKRAQAAVAQEVFFALRPPTVVELRQTKGDQPTWIAEVDLPFDLADELAADHEFEFGVPGSLGTEAWRSCGRGKLVGGDQTSEFALDANAQPERIRKGRTLLKPVPAKQN